METIQARHILPGDIIQVEFKQRTVKHSRPNACWGSTILGCGWGLSFVDNYSITVPELFLFIKNPHLDVDNRPKEISRVDELVKGDLIYVDACYGNQHKIEKITKRFFKYNIYYLENTAKPRLSRNGCDLIIVERYCKKCHQKRLGEICLNCE